MKKHLEQTPQLCLTLAEMCRDMFSKVLMDVLAGLLFIFIDPYIMKDWCQTTGS